MDQYKNLIYPASQIDDILMDIVNTIGTYDSLYDMIRSMDQDIDSKADSSAVESVSTNLNAVLNANRKNKFYKKMDRPETVTENSVTMTWQADRSILLSGTASAQTDFYLGINYVGSDFKYGDIFCGVPADSGIVMFIQLAASPYTRYANDSGNGATVPSTLVSDSPYRIILRIPSGTNVEGIVVKPMICDPVLYAIDSSFQTGYPSNYELYKMVYALQNPT